MTLIIVNEKFIILTAVKITVNVNGCIFCNLSHIMRKPDFCLCKNKGADQLCRNFSADQRLCFRYMDSIIPSLPFSKISYVPAQTCLRQTCSETQKTSFLALWLICKIRK